MKQKQIQYKISNKFTPEVIEEVLEVQKEEGLTPESLLDKAKKKSSNLYNFFDWDNSSASEKWRLHQARLIINEIKIIVEDKEYYAFENVRVEVSNNKEDSKTSSGENKTTYLREYKPLVEIMSNEEYRKQMISRALSEVSYWREKHKDLKELKPIFVLIEQTKKKWQNKK